MVPDGTNGKKRPKDISSKADSLREKQGERRQIDEETLENTKRGRSKSSLHPIHVAGEETEAQKGPTRGLFTCSENS